jgi:hypothetical protein
MLSMKGGDQEPTNIREGIEAEITALAMLQIKAVQDATFMGWVSAELIAYEERRIRIAWLREQLADLDAA